MDKKLVIALILLIIGYLGLISVQERQNHASLKLSQLWKMDLAQLSSTEALHEGLNQLKSVRLINAQNDLTAEIWATHLKHPFETNDDGTYHMEVLIISEPYDDGTMALLLHHLIHIPSGNSVWELGRTYKL